MPEGEGARQRRASGVTRKEPPHSKNPRPGALHPPPRPISRSLGTHLPQPARHPDRSCESQAGGHLAKPLLVPEPQSQGD